MKLVFNYRVSDWFSLPFAYKRKWEREGKALTLCAPARSNSARQRGKSSKSAKGVWGKTRVFPHSLYQFLDVLISVAVFT